MFTAWGAFLISTLMMFIPLSIVHFVSFLVLGRILERGTVLTALAATGISLGIGTALIVLMTMLISIQESLLQVALMPLIPLYVFVLFVPIIIMYRMPIVQAIGTSLLVGLSSVSVLTLIPILMWSISILIR